MLPQKVLHLSDAKKVKKFQFGTYAVQPKIDGWYVYFDKIEDKISNFKSSRQREIPSFEPLNRLFNSNIGSSKNYRFIFEATIPGKDFHTMNGIFNRKYEEAEGILLHLHDVIPYDKLETPYRERLILINYWYDYLLDFLGDSKLCRVPTLEITSSENKVMEIFNSVREEDIEGVILRDINAGYSPGKRNNSLMKIKEEVSIDCLIVDWFWSKGEKGNDAMNLSLLTPYREIIKVLVPRFSDIDYIIDNMQRIKGQVVEVKAMEQLPSGQLREPRFKCFRFNK